MFYLRFRYVLDKWFQQSLLLWNPKERLRRGRYWNSGRRRRRGRLWRRVLSCFGICRICVAVFAQQRWLFFTHFSSLHHALHKVCCSKKRCWANTCHLQQLVYQLVVRCVKSLKRVLDRVELGFRWSLLHWYALVSEISKPKRWRKGWDVNGDFGGMQESRWAAFVLDSPTLSWEITSAVHWWSHFRFQCFYIWHIVFRNESTFNVSYLLLFLLEIWMVSHKTAFFTTCNSWLYK